MHSAFNPDATEKLRALLNQSDKFDSNEILSLLTRYADPDTKDSEGNSLLAVLAKHNKVKIYSNLIRTLINGYKAKFIVSDARSTLWDDLELITLIGKGTFASVYQGKFDNQDVAIKTISDEKLNKDFDNQQRYFFNEIYIMNKLTRMNAPNICPFVACIPDSYAIISKFIALGSLLAHIQTPFTFSETYEISSAILNGLVIIHENGFIHRDIKSANILLEKNGNKWNALITDFGLAITQDETFPGTGCGSPDYMALETLKGLKHSIQSDIYGFSVINVELLVHKPIDETRPKEIDDKDKLIDYLENKRAILPPDTPPKMSAIIKWCWQNDKNLRPTSKQLQTETSGDLDTLSDILTSKLNLGI